MRDDRFFYTERGGFALIELLTAMVILVVLAAIALPQYVETRTTAYDATAKSDLRNLATHQEKHFHDFGQYASEAATTGSPDSSTVIVSTSADMEIGQNIDIVSGGGAGSPDQYTAQAKHPRSEDCFELTVGRGSGSEAIERQNSCSLGGS